MDNKPMTTRVITLPMALMDAIPVLLFCGTMGLLASLWPSPLFLIGGGLCALSGCGKVLWKLILALSGRDVRLLNRQFRYLMGGGFLLMLVALAVGQEQLSFSVIWKYVTWFPGKLCFLIGLLGLVLMGVLAAKLGSSSRKANWLEQVVNLVAQFSIFLGVLLCWYGSDCYPADSTAQAAAQTTHEVVVTEIEDGLLFDGLGTDTALIFYPGAKVEYTAYASLMQTLAADGIDCFLLTMPYNLAIFDVKAADNVMANYDYERWYLSGHSLGGAMAASYAASNPDMLEGLILLAAYPTKELPEDLSVLILYGSEDGVLDREKLTDGKQYLPEDSVIFCIEGGNHAQFGSYGVQDGDNIAMISAEEQWQQTEEQILSITRKGQSKSDTTT